MDLTNYPYASTRSVILGQRGAVATSQPLATLAGMEMLWAGGSAVDAALATAIALTVLEPTSNGIGGDAFALVWDGQLHGLNGSGRSPAALTGDRVAGLTAIPPYDWLAVTVPGAVSAWVALWQRWGRLPFEQLFAPAIRYAESGFPVSPVTATLWQKAESVYLALQQPQFQPFQQVFFPKGRAPRPGEIWGSAAHAATLREIAASGGEAVYRGELADRLATFAAQTGGLLTGADLAHHQADWVTPIATDYRGMTVWELPPNTQGIATLIGLNLLEGLDLSQYPRESAESYHLQIEAMKLAFADLHHQVSDIDYLQVGCDRLLDKAYAAQRRQLIGEMALPMAVPGLARGGTVYLCAADEELMVSFIQSNYLGFGSGLLVPETGIALHNRGLGFTLEAGHPNQIGPSKRPLHTIIPGFLTQAGEAIGPFGLMGGVMQPQGHLQLVVNLVDYGMNPQAALDAPRWQVIAGNQVLLETGVGDAIHRSLLARQHAIRIAPPVRFGRGQMILRRQGALLAASEPRADGLAIAW